MVVGYHLRQLEHRYKSTMSRTVLRTDPLGHCIADQVLPACRYDMQSSLELAGTGSGGYLPPAST